MALVPGIIVETGQAITVDLETARATELPPFTDIADDDIFYGVDISENITKIATSSQLRAKFVGDATPEAPVVNGADMEIEVPAELVGQTRIDIPALAGLSYWLERIGPTSSSRLWSTWFDVLSTGGFVLKRPGDKFYNNDKFIAHIYQYEGGNSTIPGSSGGSSGLKGFKTMTTNGTVFNDDMEKLINVSGGSNKLVLTLDDVANITENSTVSFITMVNNDWQTTLQTTNGQLIYINGTSKQKIYLGVGELIKLARGNDGWYAMGLFGGYQTVGRPFSGYATELNSIVAEGQELNRDSYPRLWEYAQTIGASLLSEADWQADPVAKRSCFSVGNGTTTFRVPDLRGLSPRWLDRGRGLDTNGRSLNSPGGYQADKVGPHTHSYEAPKAGPNSDAGGAPDDVGRETKQTSINAGTGSGTETTVKNVGFLGLIGT